MNSNENILLLFPYSKYIPIAIESRIIEANLMTNNCISEKDSWQPQITVE